MWNTAELDEWTNALQEGRITVAPAEGVYGYCADPFNEEALKRLTDIKQRDHTKGFIVLISHYSDLYKLTPGISDFEREVIAASWPGPVTIIFEAKKSLSPLLTGGYRTIAVRMPQKPYMREYLAKWGGPLVSTSLNISGKTPVTRNLDIPSGFVALKTDDLLNGKSSRIYDPEGGRWLR